MKIYTVVEVLNDIDEHNPMVFLSHYIDRKKAESALVRKMKQYAKENDIDLKDESNDGICFMDGDDHFGFLNHVGGDWVYTATIYEKGIK